MHCTDFRIESRLPRGGHRGLVRVSVNYEVAGWGEGCHIKHGQGQVNFTITECVIKMRDPENLAQMATG